MQSSNFSQNTVFDFLFDFKDGMDSGTSPLLLPKNQLAWGSNLTNRGDLIHPRPPRRILTLNFTDPTIQNAVIRGLWQGGCYYKPDVGVETLVASISGRLFQFIPVGTVATVIEVTGGNPQSATATQCWLWQAENYVFWNDGINLPVFFNGTTTARSNGAPAPSPTFTIAARFFIPVGYNIASNPPPPPPIIAVTLTGNFTGANGDAFVINGGSTFPISGNVTAGAGTPNIQVTVNIAGTDPPTAIPVEAGSVLTSPPVVAVRQFPIGRMGCYGRGRVWMCLQNGKDYIAGDIVGGPSGTKALNFRDAVLNITENDFLVGGGTFTVPGSIGDIRAMIFTAQIDTNLGQGPLMIFTPTHVFSNNAPVDRLTWQTLTNPIQTEAAIGNGGLGQYSTFLVNSDTISRALDGIRSLILASQDFNQWVRTPISHEIEKVLRNDNQALLPHGTGLFFDNRTLMSASPVATATQGVYHQALISLNDDLISTVREKQPPAYDGAWPGMNIFQMMTGEFSLVQRCYQFCFNTVLQTLELWEHMPEAAGDVENNPAPLVGDNGTQAIEWWFSTGSMGFGDKNPGQRSFKQLFNGEIMVDKLVGRVDFQAFYKPDQYPCWVPWHQWSECATAPTVDSPTNKPQFRPRMGLGTPTAVDCDRSTNRPLREGYTFQFKLVIKGQCEFVGARFGAVTIPEPTFAPMACSAVC
jgi:hypothetical protein